MKIDFGRKRDPGRSRIARIANTWKSTSKKKGNFDLRFSQRDRFPLKANNLVHNNLGRMNERNERQDTKDESESECDGA